MEHVVAYGISCDACGLHKKLGCVCNSGIEEIANEKVSTRWGGKGTLCLVLDCAVKRGGSLLHARLRGIPLQELLRMMLPVREGLSPDAH